MAETKEETSQDVYEAAAHVLPGFVTFIIDNLLLSLLLLAEGYLMGSLFSRGWVDNIEAPNQWGTYHGVGVVLFYAAGAATAGMSLRASVAVAACLKKRPRQWGFAFFNFLTLGILSACEIWSSFSERSFHLVNSPADSAVLAWLHQPTTAAISPTLVVVSFVLPFASLSYGFSQQRRARVTKADLVDEETELDRKLLRVKKQAELNAIRAGGLVGAVRAGVQAATHHEEPVAVMNGHGEGDFPPPSQ